MVFVIAEAGVNHNGSEDLAHQLVDIAASSGANAVKFQTFSADKLVAPGVDKADYQISATGDGDQHSLLASLELSEATLKDLALRCELKGIEFMSTPFDEDAADFLLSLGMKRIKISSGELTNYPFLRHLARTDVPLILSTGMSYLGEVLEAVEVIRDERFARGFNRPLSEILTLLHCTSNYPAALTDVNLLAMQTIMDEFDLPVGYSDHTLGTTVAVASASVIEKHFTLDSAMSGPDHQASLEPGELAVMVRLIRDVEQALGSPIKQPNASELPVRDLVRRSVCSACDLTPGIPLRHSDLCLLRPGIGIQPRDMGIVIGRMVSKQIPAGAVLFWDDLV